MIWQRHWAEMRMGVLMFAGLCVWFGVSITGPWRSMEFGLPLPETPLGLAIGADRIQIWAEFSGRILPFSLAATLTLAGAGFRTLFMPVEPAVYTLTLPISRTRLILTRLAAGLAVAGTAALLFVAGGAVWFTLRGEDLPVIAIVQSLALGAIPLATMLAIMSAVVTVLPLAWAFVGFMAIVALAIPNSYVVSAPARGDVPWLALAANVVAFVAAVLFTLAWVRSREY
jgi:hypothetical protein